VINVLLITDELKHVCGISKHIKYLINGFNENREEFNVTLLCGGVESDELKEEYKCKVIVNSKILHTNRNTANFIYSVLVIKSLIRKNSINIIHSHNHYASNMAYYAAKMTRVKSIQTNHGLLGKRGKLNHFRADYYIVLSDRIKDYLLNTKRVSPLRICQIKPGIKIPKEKPVSKTQFPGRTILAASRFIKEKGLEVYLRAANELNNLHPNKYKFYISGAGEEYEKLLFINKSNGNGVTFADPLIEFSEVFDKSDIFVYTSISGSEGIPAVIIEALIKKCLVISSDYEGYRDIFPEEYTRLIYKSGSAEDLKAKIEYTAGNYEVLLEVYEPLFEKIKVEYSLDKMINSHINLYNMVSQC